MLKLQEANDIQVVSKLVHNVPIDDLLTREWLLTNERGSYASSTIIGCNTRGYHGLLIGSVAPPANRVMALATCLETLVVKKKAVELSTFEFSDKFAPAGFRYIKQFRQDTGVHFDYSIPDESTEAPISLTKSIYLLRDADTVCVAYSFMDVPEPAEFILRPFLALRDFHSLQKSSAQLRSTLLGDRLMVQNCSPAGREPSEIGLSLICPNTNFQNDPQWWFNFIYRTDRERGQGFAEDLWTPGSFKCYVEGPTQIVLWAHLGGRPVHRPSCIVHPPSPDEGRGTREEGRGRQTPPKLNADIEIVKETLARHHDEIVTAAKAQDEKLKILCLAADQFIVHRASSILHRLTRDEAGETRDERIGDCRFVAGVTILAGFPWFADWGRDACVALPGLLLATGRFEQARSVLSTFAQSADKGMICSRFDDYADTAHFNSVDASLWFINAAFAYWTVAGDSKTFTAELLPTIRSIVEAYQNGRDPASGQPTRFGIHADSDGLITAGTPDTQLTWMDAKYDGVAFTPRYAKAVEVNALWYNSLRWLAYFYAGHNSENAYRYQAMAEKVAASFCQLFWNEAVGYLNDCLRPDGTVDASLRPNQIFAICLPFAPPLSPRQQVSVVDTVQRELLTPYGLRTLNVAHPGYKGRYTGPQKQRDQAYHQGTVWPWLMGPFVEAYLKVNGFSRASKKKAAEFIQPLLTHLTEQACLGSISEIFDGDSPHTPRGCIAQAWSVGELIRAYKLIYD